MEIIVYEVYTMKRTPRPYYLVIAEEKTSPEELNRELTVIENISITWEYRKNNMEISQRWGHTAQGCTLQPRCLKCAGQTRVKKLPTLLQPAPISEPHSKLQEISNICKNIGNSYKQEPKEEVNSQSSGI
ncbi:hypothetical protein JTB14_033019 [Gonioctena quinquepunctata]|nr:hypothetical protein JTB14_033019 [Gonioctena quinquepunctata]